MKLQANATFGKTLEQVRNRVNIRLIGDPNKLLKAVASVSFRQSEIINSDLVMVRAARTKVKLNKPIAVGFSTQNFRIYNVQILLRPSQGQISGPLFSVIHGYRFVVLQDPD